MPSGPSGSAKSLARPGGMMYYFRSCDSLLMLVAAGSVAFCVPRSTTRVTYIRFRETSLVVLRSLSATEQSIGRDGPLDRGSGGRGVAGSSHNHFRGIILMFGVGPSNRLAAVASLVAAVAASHQIQFASRSPRFHCASRRRDFTALRAAHPEICSQSGRLYWCSWLMGVGVLPRSTTFDKGSLELLSFMISP